tara:strand:- start:170 stop:397 length:228 start_codon:yes stop_codon:yes gene_type:complete
MVEVLVVLLVDKMLQMVLKVLLLQIKELVVDLELAVQLVTLLEEAAAVLVLPVEMVMVMLQQNKVVLEVLDFLII